MANQDISDRKENRRKTENSYFTIFKALLFILCFSGFIYQVTEYFVFYFSYPTVLDMKIEKDRDIILPALSFCEVAVTSRKKYCNQNPEACLNITKDSSICKTFPEYCGGDQPFVQMPKRGIKQTTLQRMMIYGRHWTEYLEVRNRSYEQEIGDPFYLHTNEPIPEKHKCYTINARLDNNKDPVDINLRERNLSHKERPFLFWLNFSIDHNDAFSPGTVPAIHLQIHSPFATANPVEQGFRMKTEMLYYVDVRLEEEHRLPLPYSTDCLDYTSEWEKKNRTGARSQKGCKELCGAQYDLDLYGCIRLSHKFPSPHKCTDFYPVPIRGEEENSFKEDYQKCISRCKVECRELIYKYSIRDVNLRRKPNTTMKALHVQVYLEDPEIFIIEYKPQYKNVEFFSYLGGFLGCWLGISLFALGDIAKKAYECIKKRCHVLIY